MANYGITLEVKTRAEKLKAFNDRIEQTQNKVNKANDAILKMAKVVEQNAIPNIGNLKKTLSDANKAFREAASGTPQATRAAEDFVKATKLVNEELSRQSQLLEDVQQKQITKPALQNKFTTSSSPFAPSRDPLGRTDAELNRMLDQRAEDVVRVQKALKPTLEGNRVQIEQNKIINEQLDNRAELYMTQQKELKDIANTIKNKKIKALEAEAKIENQILNAKAKQVQAEMDSIKKSKLQMSINNKRLQVEQRMANPFTRMRRNITSRGRGARQAREMAMSNALIGGAFPLLFGQGLGASAGGFTGGGAGGLMGGQFGFALSLVGTALGSAVDNMVKKLNELGRALETTEGTFEMLKNRSLFSTKAIEQQAEALKRQGRTAELTELMTQDLTSSLGRGAVENLQKMANKTDEASRQFAILTTSLQALLSGPMAEIMTWINKFMGREVNERVLSNELRALEEADPKKFRKTIQDLMKMTSFEEGFRGDVIQSVKDFFGIGLFDTNKLHGGFDVAGISDEKLNKMLEIVQAVNKELGLETSILGSGDAKNDLHLLQEQEGSLRRQLETLQKSFGIEWQVSILKEKMKGLDEEKIEAAVKALRLQNEENLRLSEELYQLQLIDDLYKGIGNSIENGIVNAINSAIEGTKTLGDVARSVFLEIQRSLVRFGVNSLLGSLPGGLGSFFRGRADGGPVSGGKSYMVGERGPEMFVPNTGGRVVPNSDLGSATNISINVDASGSSVEGDEQKGRELGQMLSAAIQSELIKQRRPGGLLT